jgi:hypothetical protein
MPADTISTSGVDCGPGRSELANVQFHLVAELVGAREFLLSVVAGDGEDEGAAVGVAAAAGIPVAVGHGREARIFARKAAQVASMACFSEQIRPICTSPLSESANTCGRSMAVSVMPSSWNAVQVGMVARDDEEPRPVGRGVDVRGLDLAVDALLFLGQLVEVQLGGRRQASMMYSSGYL